MGRNARRVVPFFDGVKVIFKFVPFKGRNYFDMFQ